MTKYEYLHGKLDVYQPYFEALGEAKRNKVDDNTRRLTALLTHDPYQQDFFMDYSKSKPIDFIAPLKEKTKIEKESLDDYLSNNSIKTILTEAPEQELDLLIDVVRPIKYTGIDEDLYNKITGLRLSRDEMAKTIKKKDSGKMKADTLVFYENYFNEPSNNVTDEEKRITKAVINASPNFVPEFYIKRSEMISAGLAIELQGKKPDYLTAMMQNRDFVDFMVKYRARIQKEAEREDPYI